MQWKLGRLAHGADEETDAGHRQEWPDLAWDELDGLAGHGTGCCKCLGVAEAARVGHHKPDAEDESKVAHTIDQEGLHVGEDGRGLLVPKTDEQIGHQAHRLPAKEELEEIVAHDQHEHAERE